MRKEWQWGVIGSGEVRAVSATEYTIENENFHGAS